MRTALTNPFTPGADVVPQVWAGRLTELRDWDDVVRPRRIAGLPERGRTILGEAGLGKSTLARRIATSAGQSGDWVTPQVRIPLGSDPFKALATAVLALADQAGLSAARERRIRSLLSRVRTVAASGLSLTLDRADGEEPYAALTHLLIEIGVEAVGRDVAVLVHLDEVQNIADDATLSQVLVCLGDALAHEIRVIAPSGMPNSRVLPISVYLTGLPEFAAMTAGRKGATFVRRFALTTLASLADDDIRVALQHFVTPGWEVADGRGGTTRVSMEQAAVEALIACCCGEPFLFQLAGERAWYAGAGPVITAGEVVEGWASARVEAAAHVERILDRLPPRERQLAEVMAHLPAAERTAAAIARGMGLRQSSQIGQLAQRLDTVRGIIDRGTRYTFRHRAVEAYLSSDWPRVTASRAGSGAG